MAAGLLAVTGCTSVQHQTGEAAPAGSPGRPSASAAASATPSPTHASGSTSTDTTLYELGPNGYGALTLGMTKQQAEATGLMTRYTGPTVSTCSTARLVGTTSATPNDQGVLWFSPTAGLSSIFAYGSIATPEGVHIGMPAAAMRAIYPEWKAIDRETDGIGHVKVPSNANAWYRIEVVNGEVISVAIQSANQDCYE
jgi:hypothetical protein